VILYTNCLFNYSVKYAEKKIQQNREGLEMNVLNWMLLYADGINLLDENINAKQNNTEIVLQAI
jgi:hypothetical protein